MLGGEERTSLTFYKTEEMNLSRVNT
jgi:hypothetical protein